MDTFDMPSQSFQHKETLINSNSEEEFEFKIQAFTQDDFADLQIMIPIVESNYRDIDNLLVEY